MNGKLSIVATPIGNLEDITLRALRALREADTVFCEDTRVTKKLLAHYEIDVTVKRCDAKKELECAPFAVTLLQSGKQIVYVSDAGTPGVSDPGGRLVAYVRRMLPEVVIESVPGPSAVTAALSVAGLSDTAFTFLGFVPHKKGRKTFFESLQAYEHAVVFFESPHRIMKTLDALRGGPTEPSSIEANITVTVVRELTKVYEEVIQDTPERVYEYFADHPERTQGEFVLIVRRK